MTWTDRGLIAALTRLLPVRRRPTPARPHPAPLAPGGGVRPGPKPAPCRRHQRRILAERRQDCAVLRGARHGRPVTLTEPEVRAFSSLLSRVSERLATYEEQTHQDKRHAEELKAAADDLLSRLDQ